MNLQPNAFSETKCQSCVDGVGCNITNPAEFCYIPEYGCWRNGVVYQRKFEEKTVSNCQLSCNTKRSTSKLTPAPTGTPCDDGIFCNGHDFCVYDENTDTSKCIGGSHANPCTNDSNFCNNACNEKQRNCVRTEGTPCDYSQPLACTETGVCSQGQCTRVAKVVDPPCTDCPQVCSHEIQVCNQSSGLCILRPGRASTDGKPVASASGPLIGGIVGGVIVLVIVAVVIAFVRKRIKTRQRGYRLEDYHRVVEDEHRSLGYFANNSQWSYEE